MHSPPRCSAAHRECAHRISVVTLPASNDLTLGPVAALPVILIGELECSFVRFSAAGTEECLGFPHPGWRPHIQYRGQSLPGLVVHMSSVTERQPLRLLSKCIHNLFHTMADINHAHAANRIQISLFFIVIDVHSIAPYEGARIFCQVAIKYVISHKGHFACSLLKTLGSPLSTPLSRPRVI